MSSTSAGMFLQVMQNRGRGSSNVANFLSEVAEAKLGLRTASFGPQLDQMRDSTKMMLELGKLPVPIHQYLPGAKDVEVCREMTEARFSQYVDVYAQGLERALDTMETPPKVLIAHHLNVSTVAAYKVGRRHQIPVVPFIHGTDAVHGLEEYAPGARQQLVEVVDGAPLVILNCEQYRTIAPTDRLSEDRVVVIHPPVDTDRFQFDVDARVSALNGNRFVFSVGVLNKEKGADILVDASHFYDADTFFAGDGPLRGYLSEGRRVTSLGQIPNTDVAGWMRRASVVAQSYRWKEPWGIIPLEAMATGTVACVSAGGGPSIMISDGIDGYLVELGSEERSAGQVFGRVVHDILSKPTEELIEIGRKARTKVVDNWSKPTIAEKFVVAIKEHNLV